MTLSKSDKIRLFQRITDWSTDKMRANKKAINDICEGGTANAITYDEQDLTEEQKAQARANIDAESTENKVQSLDGNESDETKYPSTKAVYDGIHPSIESSQPQNGFLPNILYVLGELTGNITFTLATPADATIVNHYYWTFDTGNTAPTITWPNGITWIDGAAPIINSNKHYEISVLNNIGMFVEV